MAARIRRIPVRLVSAVWVVMLLACLGFMLAVPRAAWAVPAKDPDQLPEGIDPGCRSMTFDLVTYDDLRASDSADERLTAPVEGDEVETHIPIVLIVIGFENLPYDDTLDWNESLMGQGARSLYQYYYDMSCGKFAFLPARESSAFGVGGNTNEADEANDGIIHVNLDVEKQYGWSLTSYFDFKSENEMMTDFIAALEAASEYIDFEAYDTNGDCYIQTSELAVGFVVAGKNAAVDAPSGDKKYEFIWPHAYEISSNHEGCPDLPEAPVIDGVVVDSYIAIAEYAMRSYSNYGQEGLGTLAHELTHYLGIPDLYDTAYGYGRWRDYDVEYMSLMDYGCYGTDREGNPVPFSLDMWSRVRLRWVEPVAFTPSTKKCEIAGSLTSGETPIAYTMEADRDDEYFLFENRRFTSWDEGMSLVYDGCVLDDDSGGDYGGGIVVWHVDEAVVNAYFDNNEINNKNHHPGVMPIYPERDENGDISTMGSEDVYSNYPCYTADFWPKSLNMPVYNPESMTSGPETRELYSWLSMSIDSPSEPVMTFHRHSIYATATFSDDYSEAYYGGTCYVDKEHVVLETTTNITSEVLLKPTTTESGWIEHTAHFVMDSYEGTDYEEIPPLDDEAVSARNEALKGLADLIVSAKTALATGAYTHESFEAFLDVIDEISELFGDDSTTADDVAAAQEKLMEQWRKLEPVDTAAQEQAAREEAARQEAALDLADRLSGIYDTIDPQAYKPEAYAAFMETVDAAYDVLQDAESTAKDLHDAELAVVRAETALKRNGKRESIESATVGGLAAMSYTGRALEPAPVVTLGGKELVAGTDYEVSYEGNKDVGTATVTVTGKGDYVGTATGSFQIRASRWVRLAGANAVETMQAIVKADGVFKAGGSDTVVVAGRRDFKGALAGVALAGLYKAPLVTTDGQAAALSAPAKAELQRLKPTRVLVVGGTGAVPAAHLKGIQSALPKAKVTRVSDKTASATAVAIATVGKTAPTKWGKTCVVATQASFKDAMSIAPYAYAKHAPVFFTESTKTGDGKDLSSATVSAIKKGGFTKVIIVGGELAVPKSVETQLKGISCQRLAGANAIGTCKAIAQFELKNGMNRKYLSVATTKDYADALAGAALAGAQGSVLVLTNQSGGFDAFDAVYSAKELVRGHILGGTAAISESNAIHFREK